VVGLNPSFGRFPIDGLPELFDSISHHAPLTRCVEDAALFLDVTQGHDDADILSVPHLDPVRPKPGSVEGLHVPFSTALGCWAVEPALVDALDDALAHSGAHVEPIDAGVTPHNEEIWGQVWAVFMVAYYGHLVAEHHERIDPAVLALIEAGQSMGAVELKRLEIERSDLWGRMAPIFRTHDVLLCPTMAIGPVPPGSPSGRRWGSWMRPATTAPR
jgi:Asp-tRNA(Asn)/Glu-tRNA(Gln) amidotransferase A subunit family amidase